MTNAWITIGFTYDANEREYCLVKEMHELGVCLGCTEQFEYNRPAFCFWCKTPRLVDWTTGHNSLDSFLMKSWSNTKHKADAYLQWIEYSQLENVQETALLQYECTADWFESPRTTLVGVLLKTIVDGQNSQSFDFYQVKRFH